MVTSFVLCCDAISFFVIRKCQSQKLMKIVNIDKEILHLFWMTWRISVKFLGKMWLMMILEITENQGFTFSLEDTFSEKPKRGSN